MTENKNKWSRRRFLKATGTAGLGALMAPVNKIATAGETPATVPTRPFGQTGVDVSILSLGGMFNIASNQLMMKQALRWGDWKGVRLQMRRDPDNPLELYNLKEDLEESRNVAELHPGVAGKIAEMMRAAHTDSGNYSL